MSQVIPGKSKCYTLRLTPHQDVKQSILAFAKENNIKAGYMLTAVGSLEVVHLRYANQDKGTPVQAHVEVVSLTGTFSQSAHLHMAVSDSTGRTFGGHLLDGNLVYTTLELVIADLEDVEFVREKDPAYGYDELVVKPRIKPK